MCQRPDRDFLPAPPPELLCSFGKEKCDREPGRQTAPWVQPWASQGCVDPCVARVCWHCCPAEVLGPPHQAGVGFARSPSP